MVIFGGSLGEVWTLPWFEGGEVVCTLPGGGEARRRDKKHKKKHPQFTQGGRGRSSSWKKRCWLANPPRGWRGG